MPFLPHPPRRYVPEHSHYRTRWTTYRRGRLVSYTYRSDRLEPRHATIRAAAAVAGHYAETVAYALPRRATTALCTVIGIVGDPELYGQARRAMRLDRRTRPSPKLPPGGES